MKQALGLRLGQHLAMTPRMRQALRLLQVSAMELRSELRQLHDANYMLEMDDAVPDEEWMRGAPGREYDDRGPDAFPAPEGSMREKLLRQLDRARLSDADRLIGAVIIDSLDEHGYLRGSMDELLRALERLGHRTGHEEVEAVLQRVQRFDPAGVAARSLAECLLRQIEELAPRTPYRALAARIAHHHLEALSRRGLAGLERRLEVGREELDGALALLRRLNPRPGAGDGDAPTGYVIPDLRVFRDGRGWEVELNAGAVPKLRINPTYAEFVRRGSHGAENESLRQHLREARWIIRSLGHRAETLLRVGRAIVRRQSGFLEIGEEGMQPLTLRDIAGKLDLHESTVSRVTSGKHLETPRGVFALKYFFTGGLPAAEGGAASVTAIRAILRRIIESEEPLRPWSDQRLATDLERAGFRVARRTVAKYREAMGIPPSHQRRRGGAVRPNAATST